MMISAITRASDYLYLAFMAIEMSDCRINFWSSEEPIMDIM